MNGMHLSGATNKMGKTPKRNFLRARFGKKEACCENCLAHYLGFIVGGWGRITMVTFMRLWIRKMSN
jgi:hypothetical protein